MNRSFVVSGGHSSHLMSFSQFLPDVILHVYCDNSPYFSIKITIYYIRKIENFMNKLNNLIEQEY